MKNPPSDRPLPDLGGVRSSLLSRTGEAQPTGAGHGLSRPTVGGADATARNVGLYQGALIMTHRDRVGGPSEGVGPAAWFSRQGLSFSGHDSRHGEDAPTPAPRRSRKCLRRRIWPVIIKKTGPEGPVSLGRFHEGPKTQSAGHNARLFFYGFFREMQQDFVVFEKKTQHLVFLYTCCPQFCPHLRPRFPSPQNRVRRRGRRQAQRSAGCAGTVPKGLVPPTTAWGYECGRSDRACRTSAWVASGHLSSGSAAKAFYEYAAWPSPACKRWLNPRKAGILRVSTKVGTVARWAENRPLSSKRRRNPESANAVPSLGTMPPAT